MSKQKKEETPVDEELTHNEPSGEKRQEVQQEQEFSFPEYRLTIKATSLDEAKKKLNEELKKHKTL